MIYLLSLIYNISKLLNKFLLELLFKCSRVETSCRTTRSGTQIFSRVSVSANLPQQVSQSQISLRLRSSLPVNFFRVIGPELGRNFPSGDYAPPRQVDAPRFGITEYRAAKYSAPGSNLHLLPPPLATLSVWEPH